MGKQVVGRQQMARNGGRKVSPPVRPPRQGSTSTRPLPPAAHLPLHAFFLDATKETYNQGLPLSIYPKKTPVTSMCGL
jgi:hypothetical protein